MRINEFQSGYSLFHELSNLFIPKWIDTNPSLFLLFTSPKRSLLHYLKGIPTCLKTLFLKTFYQYLLMQNVIKTGILNNNILLSTHHTHSWEISFWFTKYCISGVGNLWYTPHWFKEKLSSFLFFNFSRPKKTRHCFVFMYLNIYLCTYRVLVNLGAISVTTSTDFLNINFSSNTC